MKDITMLSDMETDKATNYILDAIILRFENDLRELLTRQSKSIIDEAVKAISSEVELTGARYRDLDVFGTKIVITVNDRRNKVV